MSTKITIGIVALFIIGAVTLVVINKSSVPEDENDDQTSQSVETINPDANPPVSETSTSTSSTGDKTYTLADVSSHSNKTSCWSAVNGKVYDLTSWIGEHPGGPEAINSICGKDGSAGFNGQHGGQPQPTSVLTKFLIGSLAK